MNTVKKWFPFSDCLEFDKNSILVFCFHHAGGSAAVYRKWINANDRKIAFVPIELPGKGCRMNEEYIYNMEEIARLVAKAITSFANGRKYILYGHSMGAAVAFKTAYEIEKNYLNKPSALIVSGRHSPSISLSDRYNTDMEDDALVDELRIMNGTPKEILENRELLNVFIPLIKMDYKLNESFVYNNEIINIPIYAYAGTEDIDATIDMLEDWRGVTTNDFVKRRFEGGHFFVFELGEQYINTLKSRICAFMSAA